MRFIGMSFLLCWGIGWTQPRLDVKDLAYGWNPVTAPKPALMLSQSTGGESKWLSASKLVLVFGGLLGYAGAYYYYSDATEQVEFQKELQNQYDGGTGLTDFASLKDQHHQAGMRADQSWQKMWIWAGGGTLSLVGFTWIQVSF